MTQKIEKRILDTLLGSKNVLITAHENPDGDSIGSQLALSRLLSHENIPHQIVNDGNIPRQYQFMPGIHNIHFADEDDLSENSHYDTILILECSRLERIGRTQKLITGSQSVLINIDHHQDNSAFGEINWTDAKASAAGEMVYGLLQFGSHEIDSDMATNLYTAILTDTGRFYFTTTTPRCLRVAADLVELGADPDYITRQVYYNQRPESLRLTGMVLSTMQYLFNGRLGLMDLNCQMLKETGAQKEDIEGLVNHTLSAEGVEVGVLFTELADNETKISFRSQSNIDVADIAAHFGGGGHFKAAGCSVAMSLDDARKAVMQQVGERLNG